MVEQRVAAVLGRLDDAAVLRRPEREPVRPGDAAREQPLDRPGDASRVAVGGLAEGFRSCGEASVMPVKAPAQPWKTATFSAIAI